MATDGDVAVKPRKATVIVVGAGPAGLGIAALLERCGIDHLVLERGDIGQTFKAWPRETRFISPSFTGNFFSCPDLNAITPESSPAFSAQTEHPTGEEYAKYLRDIRDHHNLQVVTGVEVTDVSVEIRETPEEPKSNEDSCDLYSKDRLTKHTGAGDGGSGSHQQGQADSAGDGAPSTANADSPSVNDCAMEMDAPEPPTGGAIQEQLCEAVRQGDLATVRVLIETRGADPRLPGAGDGGSLPLYFATEQGHTKVVALLLDHGAQPHVTTANADDGFPAIVVAARAGHLPVVKLLLSREVEIDQTNAIDEETALFVACKKGNLELVSLLLEHGANPNLAEGSEDGRTPLWVAAGAGHTSVVTCLLEHKAHASQVITSGSFPLLVAAAMGKASVADVLLSHTAVNPNQTSTDQVKATPLHLAAEGGYSDVVAALLRHPKIDPNLLLEMDPMTPLFIAVSMGNIEVAAQLLKHPDTNANIADDEGRTPLTNAAQNGNLEMMSMLLRWRGIDRNHRDMDGKTPLEVAEENGHESAVDLLRATDEASAAQVLALHNQLPEITLSTSSGGDFTAKFVIWAGGEFQYPKSIPHTIRVGHGTGYSAYADVPRGCHVVIGGGESGIDITHFLVGLGDTVTIIDPSAPWNSRESDSSLGLSPYTFDRLRTLRASGKVIFVAERAISITPTLVTTASQTFQLTNPAIDATGYDISQSLAGKLFEFEDGIAQITDVDESTVSTNVFMVGPHVQHGGIIFCFIYKYRQRFAVIVREIMDRLRLDSKTGSEVIEDYARKNFLLEDLSECGDSCSC